jgi:hypothetical protein
MSEPLGAAFVLLAVDAHLCRHRRLAVVLGAVAALIRIELWPFVACYAAVTFFIEPRRPKTGVVLVAAVLAAVPAAWFLPDAVSSGDLFRSVVRATQESQGGPPCLRRTRASALSPKLPACLFGLSSPPSWLTRR